ncbi:MAG TPA: NADH-quinone oxidoreductase subunit NuoE [Micropepsaceae bacterium]|nr:NADH-quinone oxidoreductase subunit NuoE [Micropepsaceae bacterium]
MALRRLAEHQPETFVFTPENLAWCQQQIQKYPPGRRASAVIPILWRGQEQEGWVTRPMIEEVGRMLGMAYIRVLEVATFYSMFNLHPVGRHMVQVCTTTPCWLRGSDDIVATCKKHIHTEEGAISDDGAFTWMEVECLGACVNAPMVLIDKDPYEDLDAAKMENILASYRRGEQPKPGPQSERHSSEPLGGRTTLTGTNS